MSTPPPARATMRHVAGLAGVSLKTVSRVVNQEAGVSPALVARVADAVERLGYRHNLAASNLRRGRHTASLGVLVQDVSNPFCSELLRAVELRARARGVVVIAASTDEEPDRERELVSGLVARRIDGLVLSPSTTDQEYLVRDREAGLAIVLVDRAPQPAFTDSVTVDNREASARAVQHLIDRGHRRIGFVGDRPDILTAEQRRAGYLDALASAGITPVPELMGTGRETPQARAVALEMLDLAEPPTAFFAARNLCGQGVVQALQERGLSRRVAVMGFDDVPNATLFGPGLSVVRQDVAMIGSTATDLLLARLDGYDGPPVSRVIPTELVERGSGEIDATS